MKISKSFIVSVLTALIGVLTLGLLALPFLYVGIADNAYMIMKLDGIESVLACAILLVAIAVTLSGIVSAIYYSVKPTQKLVRIRLTTLNIILSAAIIVITFAAFLQLAIEYDMYSSSILAIGTAYPTILLVSAILTVCEILACKYLRYKQS